MEFSLRAPNCDDRRQNGGGYKRTISIIPGKSLHALHLDWLTQGVAQCCARPGDGFAMQAGVGGMYARGQQHERWRVSSAADTKLVAMCKATCILVFSLNHAAKSSIP